VEPLSAEKAINAEVAAERRAGFVLPALGALAGMAILLTACIGHVSKPAIALATATLFVAGLRLILTVREAQALNSARFRSLIDNTWDLIVVAEADFEVAYITPSSKRVLGYAPADLQGRPINDIAHPDDAVVLLDQLRQLADGSTQSVAAFETRMRHHDGAWRTIAWTATNLLADPAVRGYVLNGGDVTEARQAAEDLVIARDGALSASKAKSDFLSTMSHEIRTPMNGVIGLTELLLGTSLDVEQTELASGVKVSAETVSYTHLDVYKRQALQWAANIAVACRCAPEVRESCPTRPSDRGLTTAKVHAHRSRTDQQDQASRGSPDAHSR